MLHVQVLIHSPLLESFVNVGHIARPISKFPVSKRLRAPGMPERAAKVTDTKVQAVMQAGKDLCSQLDPIEPIWHLSPFPELKYAVSISAQRLATNTYKHILNKHEPISSH